MPSKPRKFLEWYLKLPQPRHIWTYCGTGAIIGATTGLLYRALFSKIFDPNFAGILSGFCAFLLVASMVKKGLGFPTMHAVIISFGGVCIAIANWPTFSLELSGTERWILCLVGILISLPLFCRNMEVLDSSKKPT